MRKVFLLAVLFAFFVVSGAFAGPAGLAGEWSGSGRAILPDGTIIEDIDLEGAFSEPDGNLFCGNFEFTLPGGVPVTAYATADIEGQKIEGIMSYEIEPGVYQGIGLFNAKLRGKKLDGVLRDLSDGSTTYFSAERSD